MRTCGRINSRSYYEIRELAYRTLELFEIRDFPIRTMDIASKISNLRVFSYAEWMKRFGLSYKEVVAFANSVDGCTTYDPTSDRFIILYNNYIQKVGRIRFTLMHEFAHVMLGHYKKDPNAILSRKALTSIEDPGMEREADMFAAEMLVPSFLLRFLPDEDYKYIQEVFDVSDTMSRVALNRVNRLCRKYGPQAVSIPDYLYNSLGIYAPAIKKKQYVEKFEHRQNPDSGYKFDPRTGRYLQLPTQIHPTSCLHL